MKLMNILTFLSFITLYIHHTNGQSKEYVATSTAFTSWDAAVQECANSGNQLATFDTIADIQNLYALCGELGTVACWLGFNDEDSENLLRFIDDEEIVDTEANGYWFYYLEPTGNGDPDNSCGIVISPITSISVDNSLADDACFQADGYFGICEILEAQVISTTVMIVENGDESDSDSSSSSESDSSDENAAKLNKEILLEHENEHEVKDKDGYDVSMTIGFSKAIWFDLSVIFGICMVFNFVVCLGVMNMKKETGYIDHDSLPNSV